MTDDNNKMRPVGDRETTVRVTILGQDYPVRADADADYVREIAAFVDARMRMIQKADPDRPSLHISILAALNLTDELFTLRREKQELVERYERKVREFTEHLNRGLLE
ncbi:cell division protein ZapA [candidate division KSB1 bacterium]|nr:MAG: cell division protein ZapA [candidate division KSB1 bacterium]